jgi:hypothetical protein
VLQLKENMAAIEVVPKITDELLKKIHDITEPTIA